MMQFELIYKEHYPSVWRYVHRHIANFHDAEEIVAETFVYAFKHWAEFDERKAPIQAWLYVIASSRLKNYYRDHRAELSLDILPQADLPVQADICAESVELMLLRETLRKLLLRLSERERAVVIYRYFYDNSSEEIAKQLNLSSGNVRVILSRSLRKMSGWIGEVSRDG